MIPLYIGAGIVLTGLVIVGWLMFTEKQNNPDEPVPAQDKAPKETAIHVLKRVGLAGGHSAVEASESEGETPSFWSNILNRIGLGKFFNKEEEIVGPMPTLRLDPEISPVKSALSPQAPIPTRAPSLEPATPFNKPSMDSEAIHLRTELSQLQEKYTRLDQLFQEKGRDHDKLHETLSHELKNQKDFNKVKDVLEKELKDIKDSNRKLKVELNSAQSEVTSSMKRINQLEEKITQHEKSLLKAEDTIKSKEAEVTQLKAQLQQAKEASSAPPPDVAAPTLANIEEPEASTMEPAAENIPAADVAPVPIPESPQEEKTTSEDEPPTLKTETSVEQAPSKQPPPVPEVTPEAKTGPNIDVATPEPLAEDKKDYIKLPPDILKDTTKPEQSDPPQNT